ncbi:FHA domain-containing protein [Comamonas sp. SY3]|uniref:FHA domain-containing protein n=1 Tax=Comamonas sp. SY3 TaxID=3243601 RepID=UPI0035946BDC
MPRLIVSLDGVVIQDYVLTESRVTLGRRSTNDIVLTDMAVSGEHVAFTYEKKIGIVVVEDLGSTNGTKVNGLKVRRQVLQSGDLLDVGKCRIRFLMNSLVPESHYLHASEAGSLTAKPAHADDGEDSPTVPADFPPAEGQPYTPSPYLRAVSGERRHHFVQGRHHGRPPRHRRRCTDQARQGIRCYQGRWFG